MTKAMATISAMVSAIRPTKFHSKEEAKRTAEFLEMSGDGKANIVKYPESQKGKHHAI
jgi:hypothetical protein